MTLREILDEHKDEFLYIGSATGYFHIGPAPSCEDIEKIDSMYQHRHIRARAKYQTELDSAPERIKFHKLRVKEITKEIKALEKRYPKLKRLSDELAKVKDKSSKEYKDKKAAYDKHPKKSKLNDLRKNLLSHKNLVEEIPKRCDFFVRRMAELTEMIENGKPFLDREVIGTFKHETSPEGLAIIIEGMEKGDYWFYEEVEKKGKNK